MIEKIKQLLYKYLKKNSLDDESRDKRFVNYDSAQTILILFESNFTEKNPEIRYIQQLLKEDKKKVTLLGFVDKKQTDSAVLPHYRIFHHQDFLWYGKPKSEALNYIHNLRFDLVLDLTVNELYPMAYILEYVNASCKVGLKKSIDQQYDFSIDLSSIVNSQSENEEILEIDATFLYNQLIFYLKNIKTND